MCCLVKTVGCVKSFRALAIMMNGFSGSADPVCTSAGLDAGNFPRDNDVVCTAEVQQGFCLSRSDRLPRVLSLYWLLPVRRKRMLGLVAENIKPGDQNLRKKLNIWGSSWSVKQGNLDLSDPLLHPGMLQR